MKNDKFYKSIVFKLIAAVVVIFIGMMTITNYIINQKLMQMSEEMLYEIERRMPKNQPSVVVTVNNAHLQSTADFRLYTFIIMGIVLILGSIIFAIIITKILEPLRDLQKNIAKINIDQPETFSENQLIADGSSEIVDLAASFNTLMDRIYKDYRRQKDFSANVAHELRTPVAIMKAQVDVFRRKNKDPDTEEFIKKIDDNLEKLKNLIDSVLIFSQNRSLNITEVPVNDLIEEILFDLDDKIENKNIDVKINKNDDLILNTDDTLLQRLLFNVIENAIKYNEEGGSLEITSYKDKGEAILEVADSGIGISDEEKQKIFDLFYQVDSSRREEGFGIGMALSKQIAESLGAEIRLFDNNPKGSKFLIIFPCA